MDAWVFLRDRKILEDLARRLSMCRKIRPAVLQSVMKALRPVSSLEAHIFDLCVQFMLRQPFNTNMAAKILVHAMKVGHNLAPLEEGLQAKLRLDIDAFPILLEVISAYTAKGAQVPEGLFEQLSSEVVNFARFGPITMARYLVLLPNVPAQYRCDSLQRSLALKVVDSLAPGNDPVLLRVAKMYPEELAGLNNRIKAICEKLIADAQLTAELCKAWLGLGITGVKEKLVGSITKALDGTKRLDAEKVTMVGTLLDSNENSESQRKMCEALSRRLERETTFSFLVADELSKHQTLLPMLRNVPPAHK